MYFQTKLTVRFHLVCDCFPSHHLLHVIRRPAGRPMVAAATHANETVLYRHAHLRRPVLRAGLKALLVVLLVF
eukprot:1987054-Prymnesium_polylepis.1